MGAITDISPFSSVCSVLVNICVAGGSRDGVGKKSDKINITARNTLNTTDGEWRYKFESVKRFQNKDLNTVSSSWGKVCKSAGVKSMSINNCVVILQGWCLDLSPIGWLTLHTLWLGETVYGEIVIVTKLHLWNLLSNYNPPWPTPPDKSAAWYRLDTSCYAKHCHWS